jgi:hypothetical protein
VSLCAGAVYVFALSGGGGSAWTQTQKLLAADGAAGDRFGTSVSLADGLMAVGVSVDVGKGGQTFLSHLILFIVLFIIQKLLSSSFITFFISVY